MSKHLEATKALAVRLKLEGMSYSQVRAALADKGTHVGKESIRRWLRRAEGSDPQPHAREDAETQPPTEAHTLEDKLCAIRAILNGDPAPPWLTEGDFLDFGKYLAQAENQHRLSQVNLTATGLTRDNATDFVRRVTLEVAKRYNVQGNPELTATHIGFVEWVRSVVAEYNPVLARDVYGG